MPRIILLVGAFALAVSGATTLAFRSTGTGTWARPITAGPLAETFTRNASRDGAALACASVRSHRDEVRRIAANVAKLPDLFLNSLNATLGAP
jgi:hypothetical protein